ncbi:MAG: hypothetical protein U0800_08080 [Isosphaeraceae bacterium]
MENDAPFRECTICEAAACCVGIMVDFYRHKENSGADLLMMAEIRGIVARIGGLGLAPDQVEELILTPCYSTMLARFGHEVGPRLFDLFLDGFDQVQPLGASDGAPAPGRSQEG